MFNTQSIDSIPSVLEKGLDDYFSNQLQCLLTSCRCLCLEGKDYELDIAASATNGLIDDSETADVYLYAAIERDDWHEVKSIYETVFRPHIVRSAHKALGKVLNIK